METLEVDGVHQDYMTILYQNDDKLFIPVTQLNLIQKFVASESKTPKINKLGGSEWTKTKRKVASKIEDIADDLILLYATRESEKGYAFPPDDAYQKNLKRLFRILKQMINYVVLPKLNTTWKNLDQWIVC